MMGLSCMKNKIKKPYFTLRLSHPTKHFSVCIVLDGKVIHQIISFMGFCKLMGHPDLSEKVFDHRSDVDKDLAITKLKDVELSKDVDLHIDACFQNKVTDYLFQNSEPFRKQYDEYYLSLIGTCKSASIVNIKQCTDCFMHPNRNTGIGIT
jgi:hypothetical protein